MSHISKLIAAHPVGKSPYNKLQFVQHDHNGVPLYKVTGCSDAPCRASNALGLAFTRYGGRCFYCSTKFPPGQFTKERAGAHRDHVVPVSGGGSDHLHNLVVACGACGHAKAGDSIHDFRPRSAKAYLDALNKHIAACVEEARTLKASSPPQPKPAAKADP